MASSPLQITFDLLATVRNDAAADVLALGLESQDLNVRNGATRALLTRRSEPANRAVIAGFHRLDEADIEVLLEYRDQTSRAVRDCLLSADRQESQNACTAIVRLRTYDAMPLLIAAIEDAANPLSPLAGRTALALADLAYGELARASLDGPGRAIELARNQLVGCLGESTVRFPRHQQRDLVEAFMTLATRDNAALRRIFHDVRDPCHAVTVDILLNSERSGILRLLLSFLDDAQAPAVVLDAIAHRSQRRFVDLLLRKVDAEPTAALKQNLARLQNFVWMKDEDATVQSLDDAGQRALVALLMASGIDKSRIREFLGRILAKGQPAGRRAAMAALAAFRGADADSLAVAAAGDQDAAVRALAATQLRERGIPGAFSMVLGMLDDADPTVRESVRQSLREFNVERLLASFDVLDEDARSSTCELVRRVDGNAVPKLREALQSPVRRMRIRALVVLGALNLAAELEEDLLRTSADEDHVVRMEVARALGGCGTARAIEALTRLYGDESAPVREAAAKALASQDIRQTSQLSSKGKAAK